MSGIGARAVATASRGLDALLLGAALVAAAACTFAISGRLPNPFENEWLEGDEFHHALRILEGRSLYPAPSLEFVPNVYPPGYVIVSALAMAVTGPSLVTMRAVSVLALIATLAAIARVVLRAGGSRVEAAAAVGLMLASYDACDAWFDLARVDMLAVAFAAWSVTLCDRRGTERQFLVGVALGAAAVLVKQTTLPVLAATLGVWAMWSRRRLLLGGLLAAALVGGSVAALQVGSRGWFWYYTVLLPRASPKLPERVGIYFGHDLPSLATASAVVVAAALLLPLVGRRRLDLPVLLLPVAIVAAGISRLNQGGFLNCLVIAAPFLAAAAGVGLVELGRTGPRAALVGRALVLAQLVLLAYDPRHRVPHPEDARHGWAMVDRIAAVDGPVIVPNAPYWLHLAGRPMTAHFGVVGEVLLAGEHDPSFPAAVVVEPIRRQLRDGAWAGVVAVESSTLARRYVTPLESELLTRVLATEDLLPGVHPDALTPRSGNRVRPRYLDLRAPGGAPPPATSLSGPTTGPGNPRAAPPPGAR